MADQVSLSVMADDELPNDASRFLSYSIHSIVHSKSLLPSRIQAYLFTNPRNFPSFRLRTIKPSKLDALVESRSSEYYIQNASRTIGTLVLEQPSSMCIYSQPLARTHAFSCQLHLVTGYRVFVTRAIELCTVHRKTICTTDRGGSETLKLLEKAVQRPRIWSFYASTRPHESETGESVPAPTRTVLRCTWCTCQL